VTEVFTSNQTTELLDKISTNILGVNFNPFFFNHKQEKKDVFKRADVFSKGVCPSFFIRKEDKQNTRLILARS
jgi:hypothetical protein